MAQADGNPGMNKLAQALNEQMLRYHGDIVADLKIDFGKIGSDWSLQCNSFPNPIPKGDYMVCMWLTGIKLTTTTNGNPSHSHSVTLPKLSKGDRVIVAWVQNEVCVIDRITSSSRL